MTPDPDDKFSEADFREWAEQNDAEVIERDDGILAATWYNGKEVHFEPNGHVILRQFKVLGGAEPGDTIELQGNRLVVNEQDGGEHRVSLNEFPIDR